MLHQWQVENIHPKPVFPLCGKSISKSNHKISWILLYPKLSTSSQNHSSLTCWFLNIQQYPEKNLDLCALFQILYMIYHSSPQPVIINEKTNWEFEFQTKISISHPQSFQRHIVMTKFFYSSLIAYIVFSFTFQEWLEEVLYWVSSKQIISVKWHFVECVNSWHCSSQLL